MSNASVPGETGSTWPVAGMITNAAESPAASALRVSASPSIGGATLPSLAFTLTKGTPTGNSRAGELSDSGSGRSGEAGPVGWSYTASRQLGSVTEREASRSARPFETTTPLITRGSETRSGLSSGRRLRGASQRIRCPPAEWLMPVTRERSRFHSPARSRKASGRSRHRDRCRDTPAGFVHAPALDVPERPALLAQALRHPVHQALVGNRFLPAPAMHYHHDRVRPGVFGKPEINGICRPPHPSGRSARQPGEAGR